MVDDIEAAHAHLESAGVPTSGNGWAVQEVNRA